ncbi:MAG: pyridoxal phosphate-dependent aminotransferase [Saprospiraceae bacterium]|nr:pyridoxal phosphate-dependent aminotransferase [Saprospiraceae bacterium]
MPSISKRGVEVPLSPFRKLVPIADKVKADGKHVYHLNIGQPDIETPAAAMAKVKETDLKILAYSAAAGNASYRAKLVDYYAKFDTEITADQVVVTTGASEAIQFLFLACMDHGDEMVVPEPFYANYNGFAHIADVNVVPVTCDLEDGFSLPDAKAFEAVITPKTKAIFITNPNNPTGCFYPEKALKELAQVVKKYDLYLFVDEVYREFCYDGQDFFSVLRLEEIENNVVVIDSVSKRYSACGARVGAMVTRNEELIDTVVKYAKLRLSPPGLGQILAEGALEMDDSYMNEVKQEYDRRRNVVFERLQKMDGVISYLPGGAFYCFAEFPVENADHFCQWLLEKFEYKGSTVMLSPGEGFYATPGLGVNQVRIAYVLNTKDLHAAMDCLEEALQVYPGRIKVGQWAAGTALV